MSPQLQLQTFTFSDRSISLYIPLQQDVQDNYLSQKQNNAEAPFPYWAKVWPAAMAMAEFLIQHNSYIQNKRVLELAAGLGLPSIVAAQFARHVICSDYLPQAVEIVQQSIHYNLLTNIESTLINWHQLPPRLLADVVLLSDINYDPVEFDVLYKVIERFLLQGTTIILSTPQRLMAKPFIDLLLPLCTQQQEVAVTINHQKIMTSVFVLQQPKT